MRFKSFVLAFVLLRAAAVSAQGTADLVGRVTDASGAVLPGVTVTVTHQGTNDIRTTTTNAAGDYVFNLLPIGRYTVTIELAGFETQTVTVALATGDRTRLDARVQPGTVAEAVTVTGGTPRLQTDSATVGSLIGGQEVQDLPTRGRNITQLVQVLPGANEGLENALGSGERPDDRRQTSAIAINGSRDNLNNHLIDGLDNNERIVGTIGIKPSIDAIAEVKVQTNLYTAEVGRTAGGVVNVLTKSGTNEFHGSGFLFARDDRFGAREFFAPEKPKLDEQQFGGSLGGPLVRDRTFFFVDYEGFRSDSGTSNVTTVPTEKMRRGDFSELSVPIVDPLTGEPFPNNQIPADRIDPIGQQYMDLYPLPTQPGLGSNYRSVTEGREDSNTFDLRIDHRLNTTTSLFGRFSRNALEAFTPSGCPANADGINPNCDTGGPNRFPGRNETTVSNGQVNITRAWSPTLVSEVRAGYLDLRIDSVPVNFGRNVSDEFGIPGVNVDEATSGLTRIAMSETSDLGDANFLPLFNDNETVQVNGVLIKTWGAHNTKVGAGFIAREVGVFQAAQTRGQLTFNTQRTNDGDGFGGHAAASLLLGLPTRSLRAAALFTPTLTTLEPSVFVQDDWRVRDWLTLNLGVRYDVFTPFTEAEDRISNFDIPTASLIVAGQEGISRSAGIATDFGNIAPRVGASLTLPGRLVLRGGFGLAYVPDNQGNAAMLKNPPFTSTFGPIINNGESDAPPLFLADGFPSLEPSSAEDPSGTINAISRDFKSIRAYQFNVILEKELGTNVLGIGYVGARDDRVSRDSAGSAGPRNINLAPIGPGPVQARRPFNDVLPGVAAINVRSSEFERFYDALQLWFVRRYQDGFAFNVNYTLASNEQTFVAPWDISRIERFNANNDVRHRAAIMANYELPFGRAATGIVGALVRDWQVNLLAIWQSGRPFNIRNATGRTNTGGGDRPNLVGDPALDDPSVDLWVNPNAFEAQPQFTIGENVVPRNLLHGPSQRWVDVSAFKTISLSGAMRLQLRIEVFNVFNRPNFRSPNGAFGSPAFGQITDTIGTPRQIRFAAKLLF